MVLESIFAAWTTSFIPGLGLCHREHFSYQSLCFQMMHTARESAQGLGETDEKVGVLTLNLALPSKHDKMGFLVISKHFTVDGKTILFDGS